MVPWATKLSVVNSSWLPPDFNHYMALRSIKSLGNQKNGSNSQGCCAATAHVDFRTSVDLLHFAVANMNGASSESCRRVRGYYEEHAVEECSRSIGFWRTLHALARIATELLEETCLPEVQAVPGIAYYAIRHNSPLTLLGYMAVLEGTPSRSEFIRSLQVGLGLPEGAVRTLLVHCDADVEHADELFSSINSLDLSESDRGAIRKAAADTAYSYGVAECAQFCVSPHGQGIMYRI